MYVCFCSWGLRLKHVEYFKMEIIWIAISLSRGDETITQKYSAGLVYEKKNVVIGIIYSRINVGGYMIIFPYMELFLAHYLFFLCLLIYNLCDLTQRRWYPACFLDAERLHHRLHV